MTDDAAAKLQGCYTSVVHDVLRERGISDFTLPLRIRPLVGKGTLCGPAWTITGNHDDCAKAHDTLLAWTELLDKAKPGHIWTAQPNTHEVAQMGELSAETLHAKGVLGCVIDGALRDANFIESLGFPCWGTHYTPCDVVGRWLPDQTDIAIKIGDVAINPGDWLHGDRDGMVCIPSDIVDAVAEEAAQAMATESEVRKAIRAGSTAKDAYLTHSKF